MVTITIPLLLPWDSSLCETRSEYKVYALLSLKLLMALSFTIVLILYLRQGVSMNLEFEAPARLIPRICQSSLSPGVTQTCYPTSLYTAARNVNSDPNARTRSTLHTEPLAALSCGFVFTLYLCICFYSTLGWHPRPTEYGPLGGKELGSVSSLLYPRLPYTAPDSTVGHSQMAARIASWKSYGAIVRLQL